MGDERIEWADFRVAYKRILSAKIRKEQTGSEAALFRADGLDEALMELADAFQHIHERSDDGDLCAACGLGLSNEIHHKPNKEQLDGVK